MSSKYRKTIKVTTLVVTLAVMQAYVGVSFAASSPDGPSSPWQDAGITAVLTTSGNQPIMVNDAAAVTGATILNGDSIETPAQVTGLISIPGHGRLEITPNAKLTLGLDSAGNLRVNLFRGCVVMSTNKGTSGEVYNSGGTLAITDRAKDEVLNVCPEAAPGLQAGGNNSNGTTKIGVVVIGGWTALMLYLGLRGSNPSPSAP
jgi:hypothetical protein